MRHQLSAAMGLIVLAAAVASGTPPETDTGDVLKGPEVSERAVRTLVQRDMSGRLVILDERPEIAAVRLLELDEPERAEAATVVEAHAQRMRDLLIDNLDLLKEAGDALREGDEHAAARAGDALYARFGADSARDPVLEPLRAVLTPEQGAELARLVDEYWLARIAAESRGMAELAPDQREEVERRLRREMFQNEVRSTYEYAIRNYQQRIDAICEAVEATPEQRAAIRDIVVEYMKRTRLSPTPEQRMDAIREIYLSLDEPGRLRLFELLARQSIELQRST